MAARSKFLSMSMAAVGGLLTYTEEDSSQRVQRSLLQVTGWSGRHPPRVVRPGGSGLAADAAIRHLCFLRKHSSTSQNDPPLHGRRPLRAAVPFLEAT